jgi:hypothetical protein
MGERSVALALALVVGSATQTVRAEELIYVEALGKGGAYGIGFEHAFAKRFGVGVAGSFISLEGQQVYTVAPYLHVTVAGSQRHSLFSELGAMLAHSRIPSPVSDWEGMSDTGSGGFLSLGYQYAKQHFVFRAGTSVVAGEGGLGPMLGIAIGFRP